MTPTARNAYSVSVEIAEAPAMVFRLLKSPRLQSCWNRDVQLITPAPHSPMPGSKWLESRNLLFLRQSCTVEVLDLDEDSMSLTTRMDDSYNCILIKTSVSAHPSSYSRSIVTQTVECLIRAGGLLLPSERLACMWRKADRTLLWLREYLQPCCAELAQRTSSNMLGISTPAVMMAV